MLLGWWGMQAMQIAVGKQATCSHRTARTESAFPSEAGQPQAVDKDELKNVEKCSLPEAKWPETQPSCPRTGNVQSILYSSIQSRFHFSVST
ncbi:unnamed protein product [Somion occarium]|uniref:Uncharacterized protein n=1 Tax=Somion occarium TaxID=3059160 RepID=A0ABP1E4J8_9APHY